MARRRSNRSQATVEPAIIAQANPPAEQRAKSQFIEGKTFNPHGATVTISRRRTEDGSVVTETNIHRHTVCRKQPAYMAIRGLSEETVAVLDWYSATHAVAQSGLIVDSLARQDMRGGRSGFNHSETAAWASARLDAAKSHIRAGLPTFVRVMEQDQSLTEIGQGSRAKEDRARSEFKLAASWLLLGVGSRVLPC